MNDHERRIAQLERVLGAEEPEQDVVIFLIADEADKRFAEQHRDVQNWVTYPAAVAAAQTPKWPGAGRIIDVDVSAERRARKQQNAAC
ncbi:MAG: hypothetical protein M1376_11395 [Planctomycetes bacterium]|nr:hypothetical protein [Planctomycetota bacterium]